MSDVSLQDVMPELSGGVLKDGAVELTLGVGVLKEGLIVGDEAVVGKEGWGLEKDG